MADPILHPETNHHHHPTQPLKEIAIDYTPEACSHCPNANSIALTFDHRGGARWRTTTRFLYGTFSALIQCPKGNTSGLNFNIYLSSLEGDKSQDEIDFEFLGKDKMIVQTNFYTRGTGNREQIHDLGFDCSDGFHEYVIKWGRDSIEWVIDGKVVRREEKKEGDENGELGFPEKPMFLYASIWDASYIDNGNWTALRTRHTLTEVQKPKGKPQVRSPNPSLSPARPVRHRVPLRRRLPCWRAVVHFCGVGWSISCSWRRIVASSLGLRFSLRLLRSLFGRRLFLSHFR